MLTSLDRQFGEVRADRAAIRMAALHGETFERSADRAIPYIGVQRKITRAVERARLLTLKNAGRPATMNNVA